jgi:hypothetical protein
MHLSSTAAKWITAPTFLRAWCPSPGTGRRGGKLPPMVCPKFGNLSILSILSAKKTQALVRWSEVFPGETFSPQERYDQVSASYSLALFRTRLEALQ